MKTISVRQFVKITMPTASAIEKGPLPMQVVHAMWLDAMGARFCDETGMDIQEFVDETALYLDEVGRKEEAKSVMLMGMEYVKFKKGAADATPNGVN